LKLDFVLARAGWHGVCLAPKLRQPAPKAGRLPERKRMTIVAGFCSGDGAILCADSYESAKDYYKATVQKVRIHPLKSGIFGFGGAGSASLCDALESHLVDALKGTARGDDRVEIIREQVGVFFQRHIWPNPLQPEVASVMLLSGKPPILLRQGTDSTVTPFADYTSVGIGSYVADKWKTLLFPFGCNGIPLDQLAAAAVCILWHVKQNVEGCGERTSIHTFSDGGYGGHHGSPVLISSFEAAYKEIHLAYGQLLARVSDPRGSSSQFLTDFSERVSRALGAPTSFYQHLDEFMRMLHSEGPTSPLAPPKTKRARKGRPPSRE
jgi:hypothetical protein